MVTFYFDEAIAKVWYDDAIPCLFTKINRAMTSADLELLSKTVSGAVRKVKRKHPGPLFSVTDLQSCDNWSADMVKDLVLHVISSEHNVGIARKFIVRPIDKHSRNSLVHGLVAAPNMNTSVHDHPLEAVREIERFKLVNEDERQPESNFRRFIQRINALRN